MEVHGGPHNRRRRKPPKRYWEDAMTDADRKSAAAEKWKQTSLSDAGLPMRAVNTLNNHGILTVGELAERPLEELRHVPNFGEITYQRCLKLLNSLGIPHRLQEENDGE